MSQDHSVSQLAKTLEEHGGGAVSFAVAFDLVLNEVVEQAKAACRATGSAIALARDGEMIWRATSGANAPDLGVRVDTSSGLVAECLHTGQVQHCADTETDPRVNADACRWLGVRSMLMAPVTEDGVVSGILEVFSDRANAFSVDDLSTLLGLSNRIVQHKKEMENGQLARIQALPVGESSVARPQIEDFGGEILPAQLENSAASGRWTTVLGILVIAAAISLGAAVGWRVATRGSRSGLASQARETPIASATAATEQSSSSGSPPGGPESGGTGSSSPKISAPPPSPDAASGGLVITQYGKVIYRTDSSGRPLTRVEHATSPESSSRLIHRVEPQYPLEAQTRHIQGSVVLDVQVLAQGTVGNIDVVQGDPLLSEAAVQAVRQWKYQPYLVDGRAVESQTRITINFKLPAN
jgi:TonB family protein